MPRGKRKEVPFVLEIPRGLLWRCHVPHVLLFRLKQRTGYGITWHSHAGAWRRLNRQEMLLTELLCWLGEHDMGMSKAPGPSPLFWVVVALQGKYSPACRLRGIPISNAVQLVGPTRPCQWFPQHISLLQKHRWRSTTNATYRMKMKWGKISNQVWTKYGYYKKILSLVA